MDVVSVHSNLYFVGRFDSELRCGNGDRVEVAARGGALPMNGEREAGAQEERGVAVPPSGDVDDPTVEGALPQVEGPNPFPTNGRAETSTENYAAGAPLQDPDWTVRVAREREDERRSA